ncbi:MAG: DUF2207 domain-containing protein [Marmoricola sp.]
MKQIVGRILALLVLTAVVAIGAVHLSSSSSDATGETSRITTYESDYDVKANGDLNIVERLTVDFPVERHGIFRLLDTRDRNDAKNRFIPEDITVSRDGSPEHYEVKDTDRGRFRNIKIGNADTLLSGEHVYRITYTIKGALSKGGGGTQFYWNLIGTGWTMPIDASDLTVHLPAPAENVACFIGAGTSDPCAPQGEGTTTLRVRTGPLAPNTSVTLGTNLAIPAPSLNTLPWSNKLDPVLGQHPVLLGVVLVLALVLGLLGAMLSFSTREKQPPYPLMYAPPEGIGPAQAAYLLTEKVDNTAFVATMMYAAEQGAVKLDQDGKAWTVTGIKDQDGWRALDEVTEHAGITLGVTGAGESFTASPKSVAAGQKLKSSLSAFEESTKGWAKTSGLMQSSGLGGFGLVLLIGLFALTVYLGAFNPFNMSIIAVVPGLFLITGLSVGESGASTKRTPAGREMWSRIGGFYRILSTPSAQDRFDFASRKDLYTSYLPWAVAFDCADDWAKKYRVETGEEPPSPSWFPVYAGAHSGMFVNQMVDSFNSSVSSAISAYNATQSSSSGGGGGFSGGGGGGGGGGGSW